MIRNTKKKGFTLIELLVVIAIIGILAAILVPAVTTGILKANITTMLSNGKNIYTAVFAAESEDTFGSSVGFPRQNDYTDTHSYFIALVTNEVMNVSYNYFSGPGIDSHNSTDDSGFVSDACGWKVAENVGTAKDGAPFLVSRNLDRSDIPGVAAGSSTGTDLSDDVGEAAGGSAVALKFDESIVVVIQKGGAGVKPKKKDLENSANINPTERDFDLLDP